jgi:hypothetical protein
MCNTKVTFTTGLSNNRVTIVLHIPKNHIYTNTLRASTSPNTSVAYIHYDKPKSTIYKYIPKTSNMYTFPKDLTSLSHRHLYVLDFSFSFRVRS